MAETKKPIEDLFDIKREVDSVDDFEHLGHDSSPLQDLLGLKPNKEVTAPGTVHEIDITPKTAVSHHTGSSDFLSNPIIPEKMNRSLLEDDFLGKGEGPDKLENFLRDSTPNPSPAFDIGHSKQSSFNLIEAEKVSEPSKKIVDEFLDFEDHKPIHPKDEFRADAFGDILESHLPSKPATTVPELSPEIPHEPVKHVIDPPPFIPPVEKKQEPEKKLDLEKKPEPEKTTKKVEEKKPSATHAKITPPDAAAIFCKMGLGEFFIHFITYTDFSLPTVGNSVNDLKVLFLFFFNFILK